MKKLLLLGGSYQQIPAIVMGKKLGYYTILCDYLPDNPGQYVADKFYLESTTNKEVILEIASAEKIDGIIAYASDPAAPTAAYVAERLGLSTNPYQSVEILCNKDQFRTFLSQNGFHTPLAKGYSSFNEALNELSSFKMPLIVKPVDSSGSKGVGLVEGMDEFSERFNHAMSVSKSKRVIIEEFVDKYGYQIAGDGLVVDGKLVFRCFANDHFNNDCVNPFVPIAASFPYDMSEEVYNLIHDEIQRLITLLDMKMGTYNFDIRITKDFDVYLMEIAPRNGGNYIPQIIEYATGVNLVEYAVKAAMGEPVEIVNSKKVNGYWAYYAVHSKKSGVLKEILIDSYVKANNIVESKMICKPGDVVTSFIGANTTLGILLMRFQSREEMLEKMDHSEKWIEVVVE